MPQMGSPQSGDIRFQPPTFNPFAGPGFASNPMFQMAMAMYLPQMVGQGNFLPSLTPSGHLFDQYTAAKYQNARMQGLAGVQGIDQQALTGRILGLTGAMTDSPMTAMNVEQASNAASIINNPLMKMFVGQMMGPELMEDLFYGSRGSAERLYQSVGNTGFFRRDPVSGQRSMSADSLSGVTREMYAQMYGPGADISEMNGLSAGRAGALYEDLYRRGVLRDGLGNLSAADRARTVATNLPTDEKTMDRLSREYAQQELMRSDEKFKIGDEEKTYAQLTPQQQQAQLEGRLPEARTRLEREFKDIREYNDGTGQKSVGEIEQLAGFGVAARSIDAQKVTGTLKQYSGSIAAVREIFGENGNPNAPMSQLITALEALTQNQIGRVNPKKMEQFVREFQSAARDNGLGIQGQLMMSSQSAAFADQFGLSRGFAGNMALRGVQHGTAVAEAGLLQGFNGMSPMEANMRGAQLEGAAAASPIGLRLGAAFRLVKQNPKKHYNDDGTATTALGAMVKALENNETTYVDPTTGKKVDVQQGIREQQSAFVTGVMQQSERADVIDRVLMDSRGTAEFTAQVPAISRLAHRNSAVGELRAVTEGSLQSRNKDLSNEQLVELSDIVNEAAIDEATSNVAPEDRIANMQRRIMRDLVAAEEKRLESTISDPKARHEAAITSARDTFKRTFGSDQRTVNDTLMALEAQNSQMLTEYGSRLGLEPQQVRALLSQKTLDAYDQNAAENKHDAERKAMFGGAQSTLAQRFADNIELIGSSDSAVSAAAIERTIGIIPKDRLEDAMRPGYESVVRFAAQEDRKSKLTTAHELDDLRRKATSKDPAESAVAMAKLTELAGDKGKGITDPEKLYELANKRRTTEFAPGGKEHAERAADIQRGILAGGEGGLTTATTAHAAALLDKPEDDEQTKKLAAALRSGDIEQIRPLLPESVTANDGLMAEIGKQTAFYAGMGKTGRGVDPNDAHAVADARLTTIRSYAKDEKTKAAMMETAEGRRLVAMGEADATGAYTFEGARRNAFEDLGKTATEDNEAFRRNMDAALAKDDDARARWEKEKGGGPVDPTQAAAGVIQQAISGAAGGLSGGISSATITIQHLEEMHIGSATGLTLPSGAMGRVTGSADKPAEITPASVAAALAQKKDKKLDDATSAFTTALVDLGSLHAEAAKTSNVSLQDIISGKANLPPEMQKKAEEILARANESARVINEAAAPAPGTPGTPTAAPAPGTPTAAPPDKENATTTTQNAVEIAAQAKQAADAERHKKYDYKRLGVTDSVTPQQRQMIDRFGADASGELFGEKMAEVSFEGIQTRAAMFSLPDDAAVELFNKFDPEAQEKGLEQLKEARNHPDLFESQKQNAARLYDAIVADRAAKASAAQQTTQTDQTATPTPGAPGTPGAPATAPAPGTPGTPATAPAESDKPAAVPSDKPTTEAASETTDPAANITQAAQQTAAKPETQTPETAGQSGAQAGGVPAEEDPGFDEEESGLDPETNRPLTPPEKVKMGAYDTAYVEQYREHEAAEDVLRDPNSTPEQKARARVTISKFENNEAKLREQAVAAQMANEQGIDISDGVTVSAAEGKVSVNGFELDAEQFYDRLQAYESTTARVGELARDSDIGLRKGGNNEYTTVAGVPTNINGHDVDPMALTEDEIQAVIEEKEHNASIEGANADDAAMLSRYYMALEDKKTQREHGKKAAGDERSAAVAQASRAVQQRKQEQEKKEEEVAHGRVISDPEEKKTLREEYAETVRDEEAEMADEEDRDIKDMLGLSVEAAKSELRAFDVADASGIPWYEGQNKWRSVGGVPISVNGKNVDPAALDVDELESVIAATTVSGMMRGAPTPEEEERLQTYKAALAQKKEEKSKTPSAEGTPGPRIGDVTTPDDDAISRAVQATQDAAERQTIAATQQRDDKEQTDFDRQQKETAIIANDDKQRTEQKQDADDKKTTEKQFETSLNIPTIDEREEKHAKMQMADVTKQVQVAEAQRGTLYAAGGGLGGGDGRSGGEAQEINGVLQLRGLTEVFLAARGKQMDQTPDNGPPVDMAEATRAYVGSV